jgi:hypothetical protein
MDIKENTPKLSRTSASFALAAAICIVANTVIACAKDVSQPLKAWMASFTGHDWTTQGLAVVLLFFVLGSVIRKTNLTETIQPSGIVSVLAVATVAAGIGLFAWYAFF